MKETKELRSGFTTGTCAAAAAKAAAKILFTGKKERITRITTPKGTEAVLPLFQVEMTPERVSCGVVKDAGDDPDVTNGVTVFASVEYLDAGRESGEERKRWYFREPGLYLTGGPGIGVVTKPGLSCPVGKYAINPVPRQMILDETESVAKEHRILRPLLITVWIPAGIELAEKTFNPRLGILGGISILGTSGVVEPMSEAALTATIRLELHMKAVEGKKTTIVTPGNYGEAFLKETLGLSLKQGIQCSNFVADTMEMVASEGMKTVLFVGHIGKLIKVAGGVRNTHSKYGDRRMEILWQCAEKSCRVDLRPQLKAAVMEAVTTEEAVRLLEEAGILSETMKEVVEKIRRHITEWVEGKIQLEVVTFSTGYGLLGMSEGAGEVIELLRRQETEDERLR